MEPTAPAPTGGEATVGTTATGTEGVKDTTPVVTTETTTEDNFDWVPPKYMKEGKPDFKSLESDRAYMSKKLSQKGATEVNSVKDYDWTPDPKKWEGLPPLDEKRTNNFKEKMFKLGLTKEQYTGLMNEYVEVVGPGLKNLWTREKSTAHLTKELGDDFDKTMQAANRVFDEFAPSDLSADDITDPRVIKMLAAMGKELSEDRPAISGANLSQMSKADVLKLMAKPDFYTEGSETRKTVDAWYAKNAG